MNREEIQRSRRLRSESTNRRNPTTLEDEADLKLSNRIKKALVQADDMTTTAVLADDKITAETAEPSADSGMAGNYQMTTGTTYVLRATKPGISLATVPDLRRRRRERKEKHLSKIYPRRK